MTNKKRSAIEKWWAQHKYLVLSRSQKHYLAIRECLKEDELKAGLIDSLFQEAISLPPNRKNFLNAAMHIWGYFKKPSTPDQQQVYMTLMADVTDDLQTQEAVINYFKELLDLYPNAYLADTVFFRDKESKDPSESS